MHSSSYIEELSKCVRCGSCKAYCPTYDEGLTEAAGARGRLRLLLGLLNKQLFPSPVINERIFNCILCGACEKLCPPHVEITEAIYHGRRLLNPSDRMTKRLGSVLRFYKRRPVVSFRIAQMLYHMFYPYLFRKGIIPFSLSVPHAPLKDDRQVYRPEKKIGRVALFTGCSTNFLFPHLGFSLINVLVHLGYEVVLPKGEVCCGAPFRSLGLEDEAIDLARKNIAVFSRLNAEVIVSLCPTCVLSIRTHYQRLVGEGLKNVLDISSFLFSKAESFRWSPLSSLKTATYHDPCHMIYSLGVEKEPRELIRRAGVELSDTGEAGCCGFGGIFSLCHRDISENLRTRRIDDCVSTGAEAILTSCPGCMLQLGGRGDDMPVLHIIEILEEAICGKA